MSKQSDELARYFAANGIKNRQIAEKLGLSDQVISNLLKGRDSLGKKRCVQLVDAYGFDLNFLITGEGSLFPSSQSVGNGAIVNGGKVEGGINVTATNAALQAENERLRDEVEWLRGQLAKTAQK